MTVIFLRVMLVNALRLIIHDPKHYKRKNQRAEYVFQLTPLTNGKLNKR